MDIANFLPKTDTVDVEIKNPIDNTPLTNADGSVMTITVYLPHSKAYKEVKHEQTNRRIQAAQKKGGKPVTAQEIEAELIDLLVKTTVSWNVTWKEKHLTKADTATVKEVYETATFIVDQIFEGVAEADLFTTN